MSLEPLFRTSSKQDEFLAASQDEILFGGSAGGGKLLPLTTLLATPTGYVTMADVTVGSTLIGSDGKPTTVVKVFDIDQTPELWEFELDTGETVVSCIDHQWVTFDDKERSRLTKSNESWKAARRAKRPSRALGLKSAAFVEAITLRNKVAAASRQANIPQGTVRTTREIINSLYVGIRVNHAIKNTEPLELPDADLLIPPYVLGAWLGDGTSNNASFTTADDETIKKIHTYGYETKKYTAKYAYVIQGLYPQLKEAGLLKNKHIPQSYLRGSYQQRLELLRGLMDTDGTVAKNSGSAEFCNTNEKIIDGIIELIASFGWKCRKREGYAKLNGVVIGKKWTVKLVPSEIVFSLKRKADLQKISVRRTTQYRFIIGAKRVETQAGRCITVDNDSHTYLIGKSLIPTHNSMGLVIKALGLNNIGISSGEYRALIIRKSFEDLDTILQYQRRIYEGTSNPPPVWKVQDKEWLWPNGATVSMGYLASKKDLDRYTGNGYAFIGVEEVCDTIPSLAWWQLLASRCRSDIKGLVPMICGTTNPKGKGFPWVQSYWAVAPDGKSTMQTVHTEAIEIDGVMIPAQKKTRRYIQSLITSNTLWSADQKNAYIATLQNMNEQDRNALLLGRWDYSSADDLLIAPSLVATAATVELTKERKTIGRRIIGVDPAHQGKDNTAIIHRKLDTLFLLDRWHGLDTMQLVAKLRKIIKDAEIEDGAAPIVNIDYALGTGVGDRLRELGIQCNIINFASKPYEPEKYLNKRAEMYGEMAEAMKDAISYRIPNDPALIQQLSNVMIDRDSSGKLKIAPKSEIKKAVGRSPDEADAAALTYAVHVSPVGSGGGFAHSPW